MKAAELFGLKTVKGGIFLSKPVFSADKIPGSFSERELGDFL